MKVTVKFEGGRQIDAALTQFKPAKRRSIGRAALDAGGQIMARAMRDNAPVDEGGLKESIDVSGTLAPAVKAAHRKIAEQERYVGPDSRPSAVQQEFGNENHPPQPFARPAFDETGEQVVKTIGDWLWVGIEKAFKAMTKAAGKG